MSDPFAKSNEFIAGKQTTRDLPVGCPPSPPSRPGDPALNRSGDAALGAATNNPQSVPVSDDEHPTIAPLSLDTLGRLRVALPLGLKVTGTIIAGTQTQTVSLTVTF